MEIQSFPDIQIFMFFWLHKFLCGGPLRAKNNVQCIGIKPNPPSNFALDFSANLQFIQNYEKYPLNFLLQTAFY